MNFSDINSTIWYDYSTFEQNYINDSILVFTLLNTALIFAMNYNIYKLLGERPKRDMPPTYTTAIA